MSVWFANSFWCSPSQHMVGLHFNAHFCLGGAVGLVLANELWAKATHIWKYQGKALSFWHGDWQRSRWRLLSQLGFHGYNQDSVPPYPWRTTRMSMKQILAFFSAAEIFTYYYWSLAQPTLLFSSTWTTKYKNWEKKNSLISGLWRHLIRFLIISWSHGKVTFPEWCFLVLGIDPRFNLSRQAWGSRDIRESYIWHRWLTPEKILRNLPGLLCISNLFLVKSTN